MTTQIFRNEKNQMVFSQVSQMKAKLQYYYGERKNMSQSAQNAAVSPLCGKEGIIVQSGGSILDGDETLAWHGIDVSLSSFYGKIEKSYKVIENKYPSTDFLTGRKIEAGESVYYNFQNSRILKASTVAMLKNA